MYLKDFHITNKRPNFSKIRIFLLVFLLVVFLDFLFLADFKERISLEHFFASIIPESLIELTNMRREEASVGELVVSPLLMEAARLKAEDMVNKGYFAHISPEGNDPCYWLRVVGYDYLYAGENLAVNFLRTDQVDEAWMRSPSHRDNIVNKTFKEVGIATAVGDYNGHEAIFVVQFFGTRNQIRMAYSYEEEIIVTAKEEEKEKDIILQEAIEDITQKEDIIQEEEIIIDSKEIIVIKEEKVSEETFALIESVEEEPFYRIGDPKLLLLEEEPEYVSLWIMTSSNPGRSAGIALLISAGVAIFSLSMTLVSKEKINFTSFTANNIIIIFSATSALLLSHYMLHLVKYI